MKRRNFFTVLTIVCLICVWNFAGLPAVGSQTANTLSEGFDTGGKTAYAAANVTLPSGSWYLDDALTGNTVSDRKTGSYSARVRNTGKVSMNFNVPGAGAVTIQHAVYGADGASTWQLWKSTNSGSTWTQAGLTVATSTTTLATAAFTVNSAAAVRFEIRKISGGANRINIDNITVAAYSAPPSGSVHLTMGNPSNAVTDTTQPANYLMEKPQYVISYNRDYGRPNWVSWHLDTSWLGTTPRQDDFRPDTTLPAGWYQVKASDYTGSGYDRGHMCPSGDRTKTVADNSATFFLQL